MQYAVIFDFGGGWMIVIDGSNLVLGRLASVVAKRVLKRSERVCIVNAEKIVVLGDRSSVMEKFVRRRELKSKGNPRKGPKFHRTPVGIVKYAIRGMLPWKSSRGKSAFKNVRVYLGVPKEFEGASFEVLEDAVNKSNKGFLTVGEVSRSLGAKW